MQYYILLYILVEYYTILNNYRQLSTKIKKFANSAITVINELIMIITRQRASLEIIQGLGEM